jgi:hypothetical protein
MIASTAVTILAIIASIWRWLKLTGTVLRIIGKTIVYVSRVPGDIAWYYLTKLYANDQQHIIKIIVYIVAGLICLAIVTFVFKWLFGY